MEDDFAQPFGIGVAGRRAGAERGISAVDHLDWLLAGGYRRRRHDPEGWSDAGACSNGAPFQMS